MITPRLSEGQIAAAGWLIGKRTPVTQAILAAVGVLSVVLLLAVAVPASGTRLTVYSGVGFSGVREDLEDTQGTCRVLSLSSTAKSVRNDMGVQATLFADVGCSIPVAVVPSGQQDSGVLSGQMNMLRHNELSRLGRYGARSYRTSAGP